MECPWCGSKDVDCPTVDIGVGEQQIAPMSCACGAAEFMCHDADTKTRATEEEWKRGWWAPPPPRKLEDFGHKLHACGANDCNICVGGLAYCVRCKRGESEFWDDAGKNVRCDATVRP